MSRNATKLRRRFVDLKPFDGDIQTCLTVLQWNMLADGLAQNGDYVKVAPEVLLWGSRERLVLQEILSSQADLVCLQEACHFDDCLQPELRQAGYKGFFFAKPCSAALRFNCPSDGSAIFYRASRFELVTDFVVEPFLSTTSQPENQGAAYIGLKDKLTGSVLLIANTHLKAKASQANEIIRILQATQLMEKLDRGTVTAREGAGNGASPEPFIILCGDFNTTPDSPALQVVRNHELGLGSLWDLQTSEDNIFTTWKFRSDGEVKRIIDYIWFSKAGSWEPIKRWHMPTAMEIGPSGLPSASYPSDHMAVCAVFGYKQ